jgi:hypothetical protein
VRSVARIRALGKKYNISKHRYCELYHMCLQYNEWRQELAEHIDTIKSVEITDMPSVHNPHRSTEELAIRRAELSERIKLIEETAKAADSELSDYILYAVTNEDVTYDYLRRSRNMPAGKDKYYESRRKFYWMLDKRMK